MCVCVCVCVCGYICKCILYYIYVCVYIVICICKCVDIDIHIHISAQAVSCCPEKRKCLVSNHVKEFEKFFGRNIIKYIFLSHGPIFKNKKVPRAGEKSQR